MEKRRPPVRAGAGGRIKRKKRRFRGRERDFVSTGQAVMQKFAENVSEVGVIEKAPKFEGRNLTMFLAPKADK